MTDNFEPLADLESELEARFVHNELDIRHVPHAIHRESAPILGGLLDYIRKWGTVAAPIECKKVVDDIIEAYRAAFSGSWSARRRLN